MKALTKIPHLKIADDKKVAACLQELLKEAEDGFRRVVRVGLYVEWIAANLEHGQLLPWIEAHAPTVSLRSIYNWRSLAKNLCEWSGLKFAMLQNCGIEGDRLLDCPVADLPPQLQKVRAKMDEALGESHSAKQLFLHLGFKQSEIDSNGYPKSKVGRHKGSSGLTKAQRANAAELEAQERITEKKLKAEEIADWLMEMADDAGLGEIAGTPELTKLDKAMETARGYIRHQGGGK